MKTKLVFLFLFLVFADQILKNFESETFCNKNIAWSIPVSPAIFWFVWAVVVAALVRVFLKTKKYSQKIFLILILSGAVSNMADRIRLGCVVDYIDLKFWPVFNLGDVYILIGIALLLLNIIKNKSREATQ